ncbi:MAG TPA: hypothetical protein VNT92_02645 [Acidimicrobiia bacterium]|nr:hypothetical protein [Acidimicrobiia bacterium]
MGGRGVKWGVLVALTLVLLAPGVAHAEQENYYLGPDGVPRAQLMFNPLGGEMPNYDRGRDVEPGLLLQRSSRGLEEDDPARFQHWQIEASGQRLTGYPSMVVWSAADMFEAGIRGVFTVYLLDCDVTGSDCDNLGSKVATVDSGTGAAWIETTVDFAALDHRFGEGRHLGVRIVVSSASEGDMIFAYGYASQRSRLTIHSEKPMRAVEAPVTDAPFTAGAADFAAVPVAAEAVVDSTVDPAVEAAPVAAGSFWPWLTTLVISTVGLVSVGGLLLASLTKPGRHERPQDGEHPSVRQTNRMSVSAP